MARKIAFIFPGQGAQYVGMGIEIAEKYKCAKEIFDKCSKSLGFDIIDDLINSDIENLKKTENTQPAVLAASIACMMPLIEKGIKPDVCGGLSLGEYSALVCAGSLKVEDACMIAKKRGKFMQEAVPAGIAGMLAIIGLGKEDFIECCDQAKKFGIVEPANYNCPGQIVASGELEALNKLMEICRDKGAKKVVMLNVSAPFHSSMLKPAMEALEKELENVNIQTPNIPVVSNVIADYHSSPKEIKKLLAMQVCNPVMWEDCIKKMIDDGVDTFIEIGPGKTLSGFMKRINKSVTMLKVEDIKSLDLTLEKLM